jgi:hypothetical protein
MMDQYRDRICRGFLDAPWIADGEGYLTSCPSCVPAYSQDACPASVPANPNTGTANGDIGAAGNAIFYLGLDDDEGLSPFPAPEQAQILAPRPDARFAVPGKLPRSRRLSLHLDGGRGGRQRYPIVCARSSPCSRRMEGNAVIQDCFLTAFLHLIGCEV